MCVCVCVLLIGSDRPRRRCYRGQEWIPPSTSTSTTIAIVVGGGGGGVCVCVGVYVVMEKVVPVVGGRGGMIEIIIKKCHAGDGGVRGRAWGGKVRVQCGGGCVCVRVIFVGHDGGSWVCVCVCVGGVLDGGEGDGGVRGGGSRALGRRRGGCVRVCVCVFVAVGGGDVRASWEASRSGGGLVGVVCVCV